MKAFWISTLKVSTHHDIPHLVINGWMYVEQQKESASKLPTLSCRTLASQTSKSYKSNDHLDRPPMRDIKNKLHALVDEFVSNLSSECDSLANNVSSQVHINLARESAPEAAKVPRPSNRTTTEVLNGLRRPSGVPVTDISHRDGESHMEHAKAPSKARNGRRRDGGKSSQPYELLSSDHSSDDYRPSATKPGRKVWGKQRCTKARNSRSRASSPRRDNESPVRSPESSHVMNYSYEGDTKSVGGRSIDPETNFQKLSWPHDIKDLLDDGGTGKQSPDNVAENTTHSHKKDGEAKYDDDIFSEDCNESTGKGRGRKVIGTESDVEELPVLPKVPVKRRMINEPGTSQRRAQRGRPKSTSPQIKKHKTPLIDASVITQLYFGRRPTNAVSTCTQ